jgi:hypothetical protein
MKRTLQRFYSSTIAAGLFMTRMLLLAVMVVFQYLRGDAVVR